MIPEPSASVQSGYVFLLLLEKASIWISMTCHNYIFAYKVYTWTTVCVLSPFSSTAAEPVRPIKGPDERLTQKAWFSSSIQTLTYAPVVPGWSRSEGQADGGRPAKVGQLCVCWGVCVCDGGREPTISAWSEELQCDLNSSLCFICAFSFTPVTLSWLNCCGFPDVVLCMCATL